MLIDLYSVRVQALFVAWLASCAGFYFLSPYVKELIPAMTISPVAGIVSTTAFFGWQMWRAIKAGPKEGELQWVEQS